VGSTCRASALHSWCELRAFARLTSHGQRRSDADHRRFFDEFLCVKIPRLRAMGVVKLDAPHAIIQFGDR
jgi:hypothetical protein